MLNNEKCLLHYNPYFYQRIAALHQNVFCFVLLGSNEDCVVFDYRRDNKWNDDECNLHYKPLCELK